MNWVEYRIGEARERGLSTLDLSREFTSREHDDVLTEFPMAILELTTLRSLDLSWNMIKRLPPEIARLEHLEELRLHGNSQINLPAELARLRNLRLLDLGSAGLGSFPFDVSNLEKLEELDLGWNKTLAFPREVADLPRLRTLDITRCARSRHMHQLAKNHCLRSLSLGKDTANPDDLKLFAKAPQLTELKLWGVADDSLFSVIGRIDTLETLTVNYEALTALPEELMPLAALKRLCIYDSKMTSIPLWISRWRQLEHLTLTTSRFAEVPHVILELSRLTGLELHNSDGCDQSTAPEWSVFAEALSSLGRLSNLSLIGCGLSALPASVHRLVRLRALNFSDNPLRALPSEIGAMATLEVLWLYGTELRGLPPSFKGLARLRRLSLAGNELSRLPEELLALSQLTHLTLRANHIDTLPEDIGLLESLEALDLRENDIRRLPPELFRLPRLTDLAVNVAAVETPPVEIVKQGLAAAQNYLSSLEGAPSERLFEAKLLVVGEGEVGKTCLAHKLADPSWDIKAEADAITTTRGIAIARWHVPTRVAPQFLVNIWDFGGQEIYHATHQFFLTKRSLYLFVWDARKEDRFAGFDYWLSVIKLLSNHSPVLVVLNKADLRVKEINQSELKRSFPDVIGFHEVSALTGAGMEGLREQVRDAIASLPHIGDEWPVVWTRIRRRVEEDRRDYIDHTEYLAICRENGLNPAQASFLSSYLHDLGVILHFQDDPLLQKVVILKPEWGTNAVYRVLDTKRVQRARGRFKLTDLREIWCDDKYPADKHPELLQLMIRFELCFRLGDSQEYVAPELLSPDPPEFTWEGENNLRFEYDYAFMPAGILTRFMTRKRELIEENLYWHDGVVLRWNWNRALVESQPLNRKVRVRVTGPERVDFLAVIRQEMQHIHQTLNSPEVKELIPCVCARCMRGNPHLFEYETLMRYREAGEVEIVCNASIQRVRVAELISGVLPQLRPSGGEMPTGAGRVIFAEHYYEGGALPMSDGGKCVRARRSPWVSGGFYLVATVTVLAALGALAEVVTPWVLPVIVLGGLLLTTVIGGLQLRQDGRLKEERFLKLMELAFAQIPLLGKLQRGGKNPVVG